jgi:hypothetical protein
VVQIISELRKAIPGLPIPFFGDPEPEPPNLEPFVEFPRVRFEHMDVFFEGEGSQKWTQDE